ncbi:flagellar protein FlaG [Massilia varians]
MSLPPLPRTAADAPPTVRPSQANAAASPHQQRAAASVPDSAAATEAPPSDSMVKDAVSTLNDFTALIAQDLRFSVDEESGKTVVKLIDSSTQEVLRQFPSEEALSIARSIDKMQGLLIRDKA